MKSFFRKLLGLFVACICFWGPLALAAIPDAQIWTEETWAVQMQNGPRPAAYLFTTSYCSTCPDAFSVLKKAAGTTKGRVELIPVFMDLSADHVKRHASYFPGMTQLFVFDGFEPAIRRTIDPKWPDITPYIVLVDRNGKLQRSIGPPDQKALKQWLHL